MAVRRHGQHQPQNQGESDQQASTKAQVDRAWLELAGNLLIVFWLSVLSLFVWDEVNTSKQLSEERCDVVVRGFELLGEELEAPPERIEAFVAKVEAELDCEGDGVLER